MKISTSIATEYGKIRDMWRNIDSNGKWRLAIWNAQFEDIDIIDKFMEVERSPIGEFDDIFFRFTTQCTDIESFSENLWNEYINWFDEKLPEKYDIIKAMKQDNLMQHQYYPDVSLEKTSKNLWNEMLRFKQCIKGLEKSNFCIYIPPSSPMGAELTDWFDSMINDIPQGIRLVTIDIATHRKVKIKPSEKVIVLKPKLKMADAIRNEMDRECGSYNSTDPNSQYRKQIRTVMDCTLKKDDSLLSKEVNKLLAIAREVNRDDVIMSTPLIASQAFYSIQNYDKSLFYVNQTISEAEKVMKPENITAYSVWKVAMFLKAAINANQKQRKEAIALYEKVADEAATRIDILYTLESYRMSGYMYYELGKLEEAFIRFLLALEAGSRLDIKTRRESTFIYAASLALHVGKKVRSDDDINVLEKQLEEWIGKDWRSLLESNYMADATKRRKSSIFS